MSILYPPSQDNKAVKLVPALREVATFSKYTQSDLIFLFAYKNEIQNHVLPFLSTFQLQNKQKSGRPPAEKCIDK